MERHKRNRLDSLEICHADRKRGAAEGRYVAASLPKLPMRDSVFDLVLCSHFLFLYAEQFGTEFHRDSLLEMMRICRPGGRVLVYPLLSLRSEEISGMDALIEAIRSAGGEPTFFRSGLPFLPESVQGLEIRMPRLG
ncbi:methyltransferase domain-containing protein [Paenibacillus herberti]|uniref:Methyltransferase type 11 domain-containing protein n=1 Tax=Paenibacillus herberti TaxID=1619309 RepID=A0A229P485_9BACL|nr:methyltransferase domain-containing protein [Paenibacillus herberti]OXM16910.1 hypothetical protein CGZ75_09760 [Paenibacillus herberti]